jgi:hypothetical protein
MKTAWPVHGSRDENITSRVSRAFWYSNKAGARLGPHYIRALYRASTAFLRSHIAPAQTLSHTPTRTRARSTMLNPRRITLVGGLAFRLGGTRECRSARARCGDGYEPFPRELYVGSCARVRYRNALVHEKVSFASACGSG